MRNSPDVKKTCYICARDHKVAINLIQCNKFNLVTVLVCSHIRLV